MIDWNNGIFQLATVIVTQLGRWFISEIHAEHTINISHNSAMGLIEFCRSSMGRNVASQLSKKRNDLSVCLSNDRLKMPSKNRTDHQISDEWKNVHGGFRPTLRYSQFHTDTRIHKWRTTAKKLSCLARRNSIHTVWLALVVLTARNSKTLLMELLVIRCRIGYWAELSYRVSILLIHPNRATHQHIHARRPRAQIQTKATGIYGPCHRE